MAVVVRTHGGLGNQIFQVLYGRLYAQKHGVALFEEHDLRYQHAFARSSELEQAPIPSKAWMRRISAFRLPKLATRAKVRRDAVCIMGTTFLDGYFQRLEDYAAFPDDMVAHQLLKLRIELNISLAPLYEQGVHVRLGDFFTSEEAVLAHINERLSRIDHGAYIITNEEQRFTTPLITNVLEAAGATIIPTGDMQAEDVLRTLANFRKVDGNDSTLLFWASILSGMDCAFHMPELRALREKFLDILHNHGGAQ